MRGTAWRQKFKKCGSFKDEVQAIAKAQRGQSRRLQVGQIGHSATMQRTAGLSC